MPQVSRKLLFATVLSVFLVFVNIYRVNAHTNHIPDVSTLRSPIKSQRMFNHRRISEIELEKLLSTEYSNSGTMVIESFQDVIPSNLIDIDGTLFFTTIDNASPKSYDWHGALWKSDGTDSGTVVIESFQDVIPSNLIDIDGTLFFTTIDNASPKSYDWHGALWKSDGTDSGTVVVESFQDVIPSNLIDIDGTLFFTTIDNASPNSYEWSGALWKSDGTVSGTSVVESFQEVIPSNLTNIDGTLFFTTIDNASPNSYEWSGALWKSDGTVSGTSVVESFQEVIPSNLTNIDGTLFFTTIDNASPNSYEWSGALWKSDGTVSGTSVVESFQEVIPSNLTNIDGTLFFTTIDNASPNSYEWNGALWKSDGTVSGTSVVESFQEVIPSNLTNIDGTLFFTTIDNASPNSYEWNGALWKSDGTVSGTSVVESFQEVMPSNLTNIDGTLFFTTIDNASPNSYEWNGALWKSDGTVSGTSVVESFQEVIPSNLTNIDGTLFFTTIDDASSYSYEWNGSLLNLLITNDLTSKYRQATDIAILESPYSIMIEVTNNGGFNASNVIVTTTLPSEIISNEIEFPQGGCGSQPNIVCRLGSINTGQSISHQVYVTPTVVGTFTYSSTVIADQMDPQLQNNTATNMVEVVFSCIAVVEIPESECVAIQALYESTNGSRWRNNLNWLQTVTPCSWYGITCSGNSIVQINLANNRLEGTLPSQLQDLTNLNLIDVGNNQLSNVCDAVVDISQTECNGLVTIFKSTGGVNWIQKDNWLDTIYPCTWTGISCNNKGVSSIELAHNQLSGTIPVEIGVFGNLTKINLQGNRLVGMIPNSLGSLASIQEINLADNQLTGNIPITLRSLLDLNVLQLQNNQLHGAIPENLQYLINLQTLFLNNNQLSGPIPAELSNMPMLETLQLSHNELMGPIPLQLGSMPSLRELHLEHNQLTGFIPAQLGNLGPRLTHLAVDHNEFHSFVPAELGNLVNLEHLSLDTNSLFGGLPDTLVNLERLQYLTYYATTLCAPEDGFFQEWLTTITTLESSSLECRASTAIPAEDPRDSYDRPVDDDACIRAKFINTYGGAQDRSFHYAGDVDWVKFEVEAGIRYDIKASANAGTSIDIDLKIYQECGGAAEELPPPDFGSGESFSFPATERGDLYLKVSNKVATAGGADVLYKLSVQSQENVFEPGVAIIVAGRLYEEDDLQLNIHNITNSVYGFFKDVGYDDERIIYLATDDSLPDVDYPATKSNLMMAITELAPELVGRNKPLTLYLVDHGDKDTFYIDAVNQQTEAEGEILTPVDLDEWLSEIERAVPDLKINVVIEACHAGSFVQSVTPKQGRVFVASSSADYLAFATDDGAYFSDRFLNALRRGQNLASSFWEAQQTVRGAGFGQEAWLNADTRVTNPEEDIGSADDIAFASRRTFYAPDPNLPELFPPEIKNVQLSMQPQRSSSGTKSITIRATVNDDKQVDKVWATVIPPSYRPPASSQEMTIPKLQRIELTDQGDGNYSGIFDDFREEGTYLFSIHAVDNDSWAAIPLLVKDTEETTPPVGAETSQIFIPMMFR